MQKKSVKWLAITEIDTIKVKCYDSAKLICNLKCQFDSVMHLVSEFFEKKKCANLY